LRAAEEHDVKVMQWEDIDGRRCLKISMLRQPKRLLVGWVGGLPYVRLWIDPQRDGYPLRYEYYRGDDLEFRCDITRMDHLKLPDGKFIWVPAKGRTSVFVRKTGRGGPDHTTEPTYTATHTILVDTVKFNQRLNDSFFSVNKHALVASDEDFRKLQRALETEVATAASKVKSIPNDRESRRKRLDDALVEADRQSQRLEASSATRSGTGWLEILTGSMGVLGVGLLVGVVFWYWKNR
jgi:hypothetical protein